MVKIAKKNLVIHSTRYPFIVAPDLQKFVLRSGGIPCLHTCLIGERSGNLAGQERVAITMLLRDTNHVIYNILFENSPGEHAMEFSVVPVANYQHVIELFNLHVE